ncbi:MAG: alpha/beta hydrolase [Myxococcales bacterium]|nr:alpha/beta hydrolase [Myxococcales bacterium]
MVLLVHGITADRHEWSFFDFLAAELLGQGFSSLAIDYRGHGASSIPISELSLAGVVLDIAASWEYCLERRQNPSAIKVIVGNSFGGGASLLFSSWSGEIDHVVATCPVLSYVDDLDRVNRAWRSDLPTGRIHYASKSLPSSIVPQMYLFDLMLARTTRNVNLTIFHGTSDTDVPILASEQFIESRGSGNLHRLLGMDHSFSAPEGTENRAAVSLEFRRRAAREISTFVGSLG